MGKRDVKKILRNWNIIWTILAIFLSSLVVISGFKYNSEWVNIKISCSGNIIGEITTCEITTEPRASGILLFFIGGLFLFLLIQVIHVPIWAVWCYLVE